MFYPRISDFHKSVHEDAEEETKYNHASKSVLFLFLVLIIGCFVKQFLKKYSFPYTVVLFTLASMFGFVTHDAGEINSYEDITRIPAEILMQMFLPILIFESAFSMNTHFFLRSITQCLLLAIPGLITCAALTAGYSKIVLSAYDWDWMTCFLFGCILSATDPVAVVALLKEASISEALTTLIEGESLLNDGAAIVIFDVLFTCIKKETGHSTLTVSAFAFTFLKVGLGAPVLGYLVGLLTTWAILHINNDAVLEFSVTFCSAFLSYYIAEEIGLSGVLAVVTLGVVVSMNKSCFSPETEEAVHRFWEMMGYFANTLIFSIVGIIISQRSLLHMEYFDIFFALATYVAVTVFRFTMILVYSPLLRRLGYGLPWKNAVVLIWGGLRGAVGLALALMLSEEHVMNHLVSDKILVQLSMIIVLTIVVNGMTMKYLLELLGLNEIPQSRQVAMAHAVEHLRSIVAKSIEIYKNDKFLSDANWLWIQSHTHIVNPYNTTEDFDVHSQYMSAKTSQCPNCRADHAVIPSAEEMTEMSEETRLHVLEALKICYWKYFEHGLICRDTVNILNSVLNEVIDQPKKYIDVKRIIKKYMKIPKVLQKLINCLKYVGDRLGAGKFREIDEEMVNLYHETTRFRRWCLRQIMSTYWDLIIFIIIVTNVIPVILEIAMIKLISVWGHYCIIYLIASIFYLLLFICEAIIKITGLGVKRYFANHYNKFAFFLVLFGFVDIIVSIVNTILPEFIDFHVIPSLRLVRLLRLIELYRLLRKLLARFVAWLKNKTATRLYDAFDLGRTYQIAQIETMQKIDYFVDYKPCSIAPMHEVETGNLLMMKHLSKIEEKNRGIVLARKSHISAIAVLNDLNVSLHELYEHGLLEVVEFERLNLTIYNLKLKIQSAPKYLPDSKSTDAILKKVDWMTDERLYKLISKNYTVKKFNAHQSIHEIGKLEDGISVIMSGIVKITGTSSEIKMNFLPNTDTFLYFTNKESYFEYVTTGYSLGLIGSMQNSEFVTMAVCETDVQVLHISTESLSKADAHMVEKPSMSYIIWRNISLRIALPILLEQKHHEANMVEKLNLKLESCVMPDFKNATKFTIDELVESVVLIQGRVRDPEEDKLYVGPCYIPNTMHQMLFVDKLKVRPRVVMVIIAEENYCVPEQLDWSGNDSPASRGKMCLLHTLLHRRESVAIFEARKSLKAELIEVVEMPRVSEESLKEVIENLDEVTESQNIKFESKVQLIENSKDVGESSNSGGNPRHKYSK